MPILEVLAGFKVFSLTTILVGVALQSVVVYYVAGGPIITAALVAWSIAQAATYVTLESSLEMCRIATGNWTIESNSTQLGTLLRNITEAVSYSLPLESVQGVCRWGLAQGFNMTEIEKDGAHYPFMVRRKMKDSYAYLASTIGLGTYVLEFLMATLFWLAVVFVVYFSHSGLFRSISKSKERKCWAAR